MVVKMLYNILNFIHKILFGRYINPFGSEYTNHYIHKETNKRCTKILYNLPYCSNITDIILYKDKKCIKVINYINGSYGNRYIKTLYFPLLDEVVDVIESIDFIVNDGLLTIHAFYKEGV